MFVRNGRWRSQWTLTFPQSGGSATLTGILKVQVKYRSSVWCDGQIFEAAVDNIFSLKGIFNYNICPPNMKLNNCALKVAFSGSEAFLFLASLRHSCFCRV